VLVGIDLGSGELQLASRQGYDLALAHHPAGDAARPGLPAVLDRQVELMTNHGIPAKAATGAVQSLRRRTEHGAHSTNYRHDTSVAELLEQPFMNVHLAPDELGRRQFAEVGAGSTSSRPTPRSGAVRSGTLLCGCFRRGTNPFVTILRV